MKQSLCEALQNKLLSVQSPLRVRAELFFKYLSVIFVDNDRHAEEFSWLLTLLWKSVSVYTEIKASVQYLYLVVLLFCTRWFF